MNEKLIRMGQRLGVIESPEQAARRLELESDPQIIAARQALEDPRYSWRTENGVAKQLGLDAYMARELILKVPGLVHSSRTDNGGNDLWTTYPHWKHKTPLWRRVLSYAVEAYV